MMSSIIPPGGKAKAKVKQACDCCHVRKIRCQGALPCGNCVVTDLQCTYLAVPKKKGPKGRRIPKANAGPGKVVPPLEQSARPVARSREAKSQGGAPVISPLTTAGLPTLPFQLALPALQPILTQVKEASKLFESETLPELPQVEPAINPESNRFQRSPIISDALIKACVDAFFTHKYPIMPILDREETYALLPHLNDSAESYSLLIALCALIVLQPEIIDPLYSAAGVQTPSAEFLISEANRTRNFCDHMEKPSLAHVQTSFFFFAALFSLGKDNSAWFYIRESMTMLQLLRLHEESTYTIMENPLSKTYCRRTFWLLFLTERAYALQRHRPLTLQRTIDLPTVDPGPEATILSGFLDLVSLFQNFNDTFLSLWNLSGTEPPAAQQSLVQLQDILKVAIPNVSERTEIQQADLLISRQWLKTMVWQLCVTKGLLSSVSSDESMSFHYPVNIARDMLGVSRLLPAKAFEANGVGILEKIFDIGCSLSDVLQLHPSFMKVPGIEIGPRDYLFELVRILGSAPGGNKYLRLLTEKADDCLQVKIMGNLSDSDSSERIEEVFDEDQEVNFGQDYLLDQTESDFSPILEQDEPDYSISDSEIRNFAYSTFSSHSDTPDGDSEYSHTFSMSTPELIRFMSSDMMEFDGS